MQCEVDKYIVYEDWDGHKTGAGVHKLCAWVACEVNPESQERSFRMCAHPARSGRPFPHQFAGHKGTSVLSRLRQLLLSVLSHGQPAHSVLLLFR